MMRSPLILLLLTAQEASPYSFPAPDGWGRERMEFPLGFAKDIDHKGVEELRFAPGMFKAEAPDYFSYAFMMWLEGSISFDPPSLEKDLLKYYKGLCASVAASRKLDLDLTKISVKVVRQEKRGRLGGEGADFSHARIDWYDPFVTGRPLTLHLELWSRPADAQKKSCLLAIASPREKTAPIWEALRKIRNGFTCPK
jgi:hypothetical protein